MVDIHIGAIPPVHDNQNKRDQQPRPAQKRKSNRERRKRKADRRSSVRGGVVVTLSTCPDRRKRPDRRKTGYAPPGVRTPLI